MNAFHGKELASLAFQNELEQLAPSYTPRDLHSGKHSLTSSLMYEMSTAHQQPGAFEGKYLEDNQDQPRLRSFLDLSPVRNMQHSARESFEMTSDRWRSLYAMAHPPLGYFRFIYSPYGMIDYDSCFDDMEIANLNMSNVANYPRPSSSWLNVVPGISTKAGSNIETSENTDDRIIQPDTNSLTENSGAASILSGATLITQPDSSKTPMKTDIPPRKKVDPIPAHPRTQSASSVPASKSDLSGKEENKHPSLDLTHRQKSQNAPKRVLSGSAYVPCPGFQPRSDVATSDSESTTHIVFQYPKGAARFIAATHGPEVIHIRNHALIAVYNEHGVGHVAENQSRVFCIEGPCSMMTKVSWEDYFKMVTNSILEYWGYMPTGPTRHERTVMELRLLELRLRLR